VATPSKLFATSQRADEVSFEVSNRASEHQKHSLHEEQLKLLLFGCFNSGAAADKGKEIVEAEGRRILIIIPCTSCDHDFIYAVKAMLIDERWHLPTSPMRSLCRHGIVPPGPPAALRVQILRE
jgi:hypothetical protein